jgi:Protein of unknown function (DUF551)
MSEWRPTKTFRGPDYREFDIWLTVPASPRSFGMGDAWRVIEAYRKNGKWYHRHEGKEAEIVLDYITHWMPIPKPPSKRNRL